MKVSQFARQLLAEWRKLRLPTSGESIVVAVSGGADSRRYSWNSTNWLLGAGKISVEIKNVSPHLNHGLRPSSAKDAKWVSNLAQTTRSCAKIIAHKNVREAA